MKHSLRLLWLFVSGAWFIRLQFIPVRMWASFPTFNSPRGFDLWTRILRDWRHGWLFFLVLTILLTGIILEICKSRAAKYVNVGFYFVYLLMLLPSLIALLRKRAESEAALYIFAYGGAALIILAGNYFLYRPFRNRTGTEHK
jgi:predicted membrane channel-forming protein YqfA (hemolysin III family)